MYFFEAHRSSPVPGMRSNTTRERTPMYANGNEEGDNVQTALRSGLFLKFVHPPISQMATD